MAAHPDLQKQAQEEIDQVFGQDQMPHTADEKSLPFLKACFLEVTITSRLQLSMTVNNNVQQALRWRPPFPIGIPHANTADDVYQGNTIPKGTSVISNVWAISVSTIVLLSRGPVCHILEYSRISQFRTHRR